MNDLISREEALKELKESAKYHEENSRDYQLMYRDRNIIRELPTISAIPIPENATNGDVLKRLLYGKAIITEFIHDVNISVNNNVIGQFDMEWWNSPYKRGETE